MSKRAGTAGLGKRALVREAARRKQLGGGRTAADRPYGAGVSSAAPRPAAAAAKRAAKDAAAKGQTAKGPTAKDAAAKGPAAKGVAAKGVAPKGAAAKSGAAEGAAPTMASIVDASIPPLPEALTRAHDREFARMNERRAKGKRSQAVRPEDYPNGVGATARGVLARVARVALAPLALARAVVERIRDRDRD